MSSSTGASSSATPALSQGPQAIHPAKTDTSNNNQLDKWGKYYAGGSSGPTPTASNKDMGPDDPEKQKTLTKADARQIDPKQRFKIVKDKNGQTFAVFGNGKRLRISEKGDDELQVAVDQAAYAFPQGGRPLLKQAYPDLPGARVYDFGTATLGDANIPAKDVRHYAATTGSTQKDLVSKGVNTQIGDGVVVSAGDGTYYLVGGGGGGKGGAAAKKKDKPGSDT